MVECVSHFFYFFDVVHSFECFDQLGVCGGCKVFAALLASLRFLAFLNILCQKISVWTLVDYVGDIQLGGSVVAASVYFY